MDSDTIILYALAAILTLVAGILLNRDAREEKAKLAEREAAEAAAEAASNKEEK